MREDDTLTRAPEIRISMERESNCVSTTSAADAPPIGAWRGELGERVHAYRARRGLPPLPAREVRTREFAARELDVQELRVRAAAQTSLPFAEASSAQSTQYRDSRRGGAVTTAVATAVAAANATAIEETLALTSPEVTPSVNDEEFSFTIAIGRYVAPPNTVSDGRMEIDVSIAPKSHSGDADVEESSNVKHYGLYPVASMEDRRIAAVIDFACLLFAYGGFMALFSSLGGQFSATKFNALVYVATFAVVYLQYFALFTIFGGTTPGMMFRGLQVASFSGAPPTPRQYLLRSIGYVASATAVFAGFAWSWWDEDHLTWHDRISRTYLSSPTTRAAFHAPSVAPGR